MLLGPQRECKGQMRPYLRDVLVSTAGHPSLGTVAFAGRRAACALGRNGISLLKREGDGATPAGRWPLRRVLYRADRIAQPRTGLPLVAISQDDGWCDAPGDPAYNCPVRLPYPASAECLWREDRLYDIIVVLGHNDDPVVPGFGSAIFMHVAEPDYGPTAGCIGVSRQDLIALLAHCGRGTDLVIEA